MLFWSVKQPDSVSIHCTDHRAMRNQPSNVRKMSLSHHREIDDIKAFESLGRVSGRQGRRLCPRGLTGLTEDKVSCLRLALQAQGPRHETRIFRKSLSQHCYHNRSLFWRWATRRGSYTRRQRTLMKGYLSSSEGHIREYWLRQKMAKREMTHDAVFEFGRCCRS